VLIEGESGTGKEIIARAIHLNSPRRGKPFVALSCAALPESLIEAELFGHERGAFTDAKKERKGRFELAEGGSLFLDDIDDLALSVQVKLLRAVQQREIERVGGESPVPVDIRLVVATKRNLEELVTEGSFREDLFYRLNVVNLRLPPLRERAEDIPLLVNHFIGLHAGGRSYEVKADVTEALIEHPWPGNVRELENAVERAIALAGEARVLRKEHLLRPSREFKTATQLSGRLKTLKEMIEDTEKEHIRRVLRVTRGHRAQAASILGISRKNLWEKLRDYGIDM
jgi:transcriptional regulator with PAS, ATPase and Fis domain